MRSGIQNVLGILGEVLSVFVRTVRSDDKYQARQNLPFPIKASRQTLFSHPVPFSETRLRTSQ